MFLLGTDAHCCMEHSKRSARGRCSQHTCLGAAAHFCMQPLKHNAKGYCIKHPCMVLVLSLFSRCIYTTITTCCLDCLSKCSDTAALLTCMPAISFALQCTAFRVPRKAAKCAFEDDLSGSICLAQIDKIVFICGAASLLSWLPAVGCKPKCTMQ